VISPKRKDIYKSLGDVLQQRETLLGEKKSRFDDQILSISSRLKAAAQHHAELSTFPIRQPDPAPRGNFRKVKPHRKGNSRALTAAELAHQDLRRQEKKQRVAPPQRELEEEIGESIGL